LPDDRVGGGVVAGRAREFRKPSRGIAATGSSRPRASEGFACCSSVAADPLGLSAERREARRRAAVRAFPPRDHRQRRQRRGIRQGCAGGGQDDCRHDQEDDRSAFGAAWPPDPNRRCFAAASVPTGSSEAAKIETVSIDPNMPVVDIGALLDSLAAKASQKLNWKVSIVDLMKLLDIDSSLSARKELAKELHYDGDTHDSAAMNIWLHKQLMKKLAEHGGKLPEDLKS
jgi:hypothetical protein